MAKIKAIKGGKPKKRNRKVKSKQTCEFTCEICSKQLSSLAHFVKHNNAKHTVKNFICDYEGR